jgi:hypothetical protein
MMVPHKSPSPKVHLYSFCRPVAWLILFASCQSIPVLPEEKIIGRSYTVEEISFFVLAEDDFKGIDEHLLKEQFPRMINDLQEHSLEEWGFKLRMDYYSRDLADPLNFQIERQVLAMETEVIQLTWRSRSRSMQNASLRIPLTVREGSLSLRVILEAPVDGEPQQQVFEMALPLKNPLPSRASGG